MSSKKKRKRHNLKFTIKIHSHLQDRDVDVEFTTASVEQTIKLVNRIKFPVGERVVGFGA